MSADMAALYGLGRDVDTWSEKLEPERLSEGGSEAPVKRTEYPNVRRETTPCRNMERLRFRLSVTAFLSARFFNFFSTATLRLPQLPLGPHLHTLSLTTERLNLNLPCSSILWGQRHRQIHSVPISPKNKQDLFTGRRNLPSPILFMSWRKAQGQRSTSVITSWRWAQALCFFFH